MVYCCTRFRISTICSDISGVIFIVLGDSEVRQIVQKTVFEVDLDHNKVKVCNAYLKYSFAAWC